MQTLTTLHSEEGNKKKGMITSILVHLLLLIILILPFIGYPVPPPGQQGILVSLGEIDQGMGDDLPDTQNQEKVDQSITEAKKKDKEKQEPDEAARSAKKIASNPDILTTNDPAAIALRKQKEEEQRQKAIDREKEMEAQKERDRLAEIARQQAAEEAAKKAAFEKSKKQYSDLLGGAGKGNTDISGNQGDPNGDPNADALVGISSGSGMVGGGLGDRGVLYEPKIQDSSQKTGRVVVNVCVNSAGNVTSSTYTQRGSTTTDSELRALAEKSAQKFKFTPGEAEKQCGTITIDFKLK